MLKRLFAHGWVWSVLLCLILIPLASLGSPILADDPAPTDSAVTTPDARSKSAPDGTGDEAQSREQPTFVRVDDLTSVDSALPNRYSFLPRKGRFELRVKQGWSGSVPLVSRDYSWSNVSCQKIGNVPNQRFEAVFASRNPVLEASVRNDVMFLHSVRKGTAAIQFLGENENTPGVIRCELRIIVEGDTAELKHAIHEASPGAIIRIVEIRESAAMLVGTVPTSDEVSIIMEVARLFYAEVVNHLTVADKRELPRNEARFESVLPSNHSELSNAARPVEQPQPAKREHARLPRRDRDQIKELRNEIRSLRDDLRHLSEVLERQKNARASEWPQPSAPQAIPPVDNPIEPAASIDPQPAKGAEPSPEAIFFTVPNSNLCQRMQPVIAHLQQAGYPILTVDAKAQPDFAQRHRIDEFPCFILTDNDHELFRRTGVIREADLMTFLDPLILNPSLILTNEKRTKPLQLAVGVRGELEFPQPIKTARGHDNAIIRLDQIQGPTLKLHGVSRGVTTLQVSLVGSSDIFDVIVRVGAINEISNEARRPQKQKIESPQQLVKPVLMLTNGDLTVRSDFDVKAIRIMDPTTLEVTQQDSKLTRLVALKPGLTSIWIKPESTKLLEADPIELVISAIAPTPEAPSFDGPRMQVVTYAVADLLIPIGAGSDFKMNTADWLRLIDQVVNTIEPRMWDMNGGPYLIKPYETTLSIVIRAPAETHDKIQQLFGAIRRKTDVQFAVETTLPTTVDEAFFDRANVKVEFDPKNRAAILNEVTATLLRERLRDAALHAPKVTCFDGQVVDYACPSGNEVDGKDKFRLHVRGRVDEQAREIHLNFTVNPRNSVNDLLARSQTIPDGGYVLWDVTEEIQREHPDEPITGRVIVLTCVRIIIQSDEVELPIKSDQN